MALPFVPGPAPIFVGDQATVLFLGYSKSGVSFSHDPSYVPYYNDLGGATPLDLSYQGQAMTIHLSLTRWNPLVLLTVEDVVGKNFFAGSGPGVDVPGEIGTLMAYEESALQLWVAFPYANSTAYAGHPLGYHFPCVVLEREGLPERGSKPAEVQLNFRAIRKLDMSPSTASAFGAGKLTLYDFNMTAIAGQFPD